MSEHGISTIIGFSWRKTKEILFPFDFKRWLKILFIVWLAGQGASGNFNIPNRLRPAQEQTQIQPPAQNAQSGPALQTDQTVSERKEIGVLSRLPNPEDQTRRVMEQLGPWLFVLIPALIALFLFFMWISARFHFIFLELVTLRDLSVRAAFRKYKAQGNSLFLWSLGLMAVFLTGSFLCFLPVILFQAAGWLFLGVPLFLIFLTAVAVTGVLVVDFVTPMMYRDGMRTMEALGKFMSFKPGAGSVLIYLLAKIGLKILAGLIALLVMLGVGLVFLLGALLLALIGAGLTAVLPFLKLPLIAAGVIAGVLTAVMLFGFATLPIPVFFRAFSVVYLTRLIPEYNLLGSPPAGSNTQAG